MPEPDESHDIIWDDGEHPKRKKTSGDAALHTQGDGWQTMHQADGDAEKRIWKDGHWQREEEK